MRTSPTIHFNPPRIRKRAAIAAILFGLTITLFVLFYSPIATCINERLIAQRLDSDVTYVSFKKHISLLSPVISKWTRGQNSSFSDRINTVNVWDTSVSLGLLRDIGSLSELTTLSFRNVRFGDPTLESFRQLKHLTALTIDNSEINDEGFLRLSEMRELETLAVTGIKVSSAGIGFLKVLPHLRTLRLEAVTLDADVIAAFNDFRKLDDLSLARSNVNDEMLKVLSDDCRIWSIDVSHTAIGDEGVACLCKMRRLRGVAMLGTNFTDRSFPSLVELTKRPGGSFLCCLEQFLKLPEQLRATLPEGSFGCRICNETEESTGIQSDAGKRHKSN
jgi:hypothetical protein